MADDIIHLNDDTFTAGIAKGTTLVDFTATWCGPCRALAPILTQVASSVKGKATVAKVDIDASQRITSQYNVMSVPTLIVFKNGQEVSREVGLRDAAFIERMLHLGA